MRMLLTSAGVKNHAIHDALTRLLPKAISECTALIVPTASHAHAGGMVRAHKVIAGLEPRTPMVELGWASVGILELTALPTVDRDVWEPQVRDADVLLVGGGDPMYLTYWMRESGLAALLPDLTDTVYVGLSAGSMTLTPDIGEEFVGWQQPGGGHRALGLVPFSIFPHVDHPMLLENTMTAAVEWAGQLSNPSYAIDDDTAIVVDDGVVEVVSEGHWRAFGQ